MEIKRVQLTAQKTLNVVYSNSDGDTITMIGGNVVHRDLKEAIKNFVPHFALLTEQREAYGRPLESLEAERNLEYSAIFMRMDVNTLTFKKDEVIISGTKILDRGSIININAPSVCLADVESYEFMPELQLAIENLKYEAEQYVTERKWGIKQGEIDFNETEDPFVNVKAVNVEAGEVPTVTVTMTNVDEIVKRSKRSKDRKSV